MSGRLNFLPPPANGYTVRRQLLDRFMLTQAAQLAPGSAVLDLGGHKNKKRGRFDIAAYPLQATYVNLVADKGADLLADAIALPLASATFATVICTEVLEHVLEPRPVIQEAWRVLQPGGKLLLTVPFLYRMHGDPYDFGRYTDHYWQTVLRTAGFEQVQIERQGLLFAVLVDFFRQYLDQGGNTRPPLLLRAGLRLLLPAITSLALRHEARRHMQTNPFFRSFTTGFGILAYKPSL